MRSANLSIVLALMILSASSAMASNGLDIWTVSRTDVGAPWGRPVNIGSEINTVFNEASPDISADGLTLYFDHRRSLVTRGLDVVYSTRPDINSPWEALQNPGPYINTNSSEGGPSISADGLVLFFHSTRSGGSGGWDIWYSIRSSVGGPWTAAINAGPVINSGVAEWTPEISLVDNTLYFASDRGGGWAIYAAGITIDPVTGTISFGAPQSVGLVDAVAPDISSDGLTMYYESVIENEILTATRTSIGSAWSAGAIIPLATASNEAPSISADDLTLYYMSIDQLGIDVSPYSYDFGDVEVGDSRTVVVTISNVGDVDLTVLDLGFEIGSSLDYSITSAPVPPVILLPQETEDVEIAYAPSAVGFTELFFEVSSDDPDEPVVQIYLSGAGIQTELPPDQAIAAIIEFFDQSVADGTLTGTGRFPRMERRRLRAMRNILRAAGNLINGGYYRGARMLLRVAARRSDGFRRPIDFVEGPATSELSAKIQDLLTALATE